MPALWLSRGRRPENPVRIPLFARHVARLDLGLPAAHQINGVLHIKLHVERMRASRNKPGWGIVVLPTELFNQHGLMFAIKYIAIDALPICAKAIFNA